MRIGKNTKCIGIRLYWYRVNLTQRASRMEAYAPVGGIQMTEQTYQLLKDLYEFDRRDEVPIKGKGLMTTYVLIRRKGNEPDGPRTELLEPEPDPLIGV